MKNIILCVALFAVAFLYGANGTAVTAEKNRPVSKVITLLKDMQVQLEKEQEEDEAVYDKLACWCETNDKEKTKAIEEAEARITQLTSTIEEATATSSRLTTEIKNLEEEIARNQAALSQATSIREKEREAFNAEEKDMLQSIEALKAAIVVLSKHHAPPSTALLNIGVMLHHLQRKYKAILATGLTAQQRRTLTAFVQQPGFFGSKPTFKQAYAPQSGEIFGVLNNMKDNFEANLSDAQKEELARQQAYDALKAAKEAEIAAAQDAVATKNAQLADTQEKLAQAKEDLEDTRNSLSADQKYLMDLKLKCQMTDQEWAERQKTRQAEIQAVSQAVAILSNDDAHDTFTRTFVPAFVQTSIKTRLQQNRRTRAAAILAAAGKKFHSAELLKIATSAKLDAFERVKQAIDGMVVQLTKEKEDEIRQKDWCVAEENKNERQVELKNRDKTDLQVKIEQLEQELNALAKAIATLEAEIADLQKEIQRAGEDREKENADFQTTVRDQQETQKLLAQAIQVLAAFYNKQGAGSALMQQEPVGPPPPAGFKEYKNQAGSSGVLAMLEQIKRDAEQLEKDAVKAEQDSQSAYETFVKDSNESIEAKQRDITNKSEQKAKAEADLTQAKEDLAGVVTELEQLANYAGQLHSACDFVVNNFDIRQTARDQEIEALKQAKAILSGMQGSA